MKKYRLLFALVFVAVLAFSCESSPETTEETGTSPTTTEEEGTKTASSSSSSTSKTTAKPATSSSSSSSSKSSSSSSSKSSSSTTSSSSSKSQSGSSSGSSSGTQSSSTITFGEPTWMIEQIDMSFWPEELTEKGTLFISFFFPFTGNLQLGNIERISVYSPVDFWLLTSSNVGHVAEIENNQLVIKRLQSGSGAVALGDWSIEVLVKGQKSVMKNLNVTGLQQGGATASTKDSSSQKYMVAKASSSNEIATLALPTITSVSRDADSIEIRFSVNDNRVKNGYFWFDVPGEKYYKDSGSMIDASGNPVNGCRKFSTNGAECLYILRKDADNSSWFDKIVAVHFVASDTNRVQSPWVERNRTVSARAQVK